MRADTILNGTAVTVLLPVVTQLPEFVRAAAHQRVFSPKQAAAELRSYTLPLGRAAITTVRVDGRGGAGRAQWCVCRLACMARDRGGACAAVYCRLARLHGT